jgi:hypothetical protein
MSDFDLDSLHLLATKVKNCQYNVFHESRNCNKDKGLLRVNVSFRIGMKTYLNGFPEMAIVNINTSQLVGSCFLNGLVAIYYTHLDFCPERGLLRIILVSRQ